MRQPHPNSRFVDISVDDSDFCVHCVDLGAGEQTVIMLHGSGPGASGWANFQRNVEPALAAGLRVLIIDFPGWSASSPYLCMGSRSDFNGRVIKAVMDVLDIDVAHFLGNSMGAHSAVAFALENPSRVGKLVLMGGGTGGASYFTPMVTEGIKLLQNLYRDPTIDNLKAMMAVFVFDSSDLTEELFETRLKNMLARPEHLENFVKGLDTNPKQYPDFGPRLAEISADTLIIWGKNDRFVPLDTGLKLLAGIPKSQLHIFSQCGHWAQWEHAERFNRLVYGFLTE